MMVVNEIAERYIPVTESGCWLWIGSSWQSGYGQWKIGRKLKRAHRVVYETLVGPIPDGLEPDHVCRVRCCGNPAHLELVTSRENTLRGNGPTAQNARKTHCLRGHPFAGDNLYVGPDGERGCRICMRSRHLAARSTRLEYQKRYYQDKMKAKRQSRRPLNRLAPPPEASGGSEG